MTPRADAYKMGTIARLSGFPPALLRAWERRHGFLEPERGSGGHRLYSNDDLRVLKRIRALLDEGFSIGEVALMGRQRLLKDGAEIDAAPRPEPPAPTLATGLGVQELRETILDAAIAIDPAALDQALDQSFALFSAEQAMREIVVPACVAIGAAWSEGRCSVAGEHLATHSIRRRLRALLDAARAPAGAPEVVVASFPDEQHDLGCLFLSWTLAGLGLAVTFLGSSVPLEDLELTARQRKPAAIALSVARRALYESYRPKLVDLGRRLAPTLILIGGRGAPAEDPALGEHLSLCDPKKSARELFAPLIRRSG